MMGEGFHDEFAGSGKTMRGKNANGGDLDGLSTKSQDIERDLGVK